MYKTVFILIIANMIMSKEHHENKKIHEGNVHKLSENTKKIKTSKEQMDKHIKLRNDKVKKLKEIEGKIQKVDITKSAEYNALVKQYEQVSKDYNANRKNGCAALPKLDLLTNIKAPLSDRDHNCMKWTYYGQQLGLSYGNALFHLGKLTSFYHNITCLSLSIRNGNSNPALTNYYRRDCFINNFIRKVHSTMKNLREGKPDRNEISHPYRGVERKEEELKDLVKHIDHVFKTHKPVNSFYHSGTGKK